jgi:alkanesulfonate monooxygenase SsuD/methylene tetrahydromethanopterin reductase-like flavin-dependent oxidoreductase (luciferase family)
VLGVGIHLPQYGRAAGPDAIRRAARLAEDLGFADLWVSDHVVHPAEQTYPSAHLYDPLLTLGWGAAATTTIGLGTSVLVAAMHPPLALANSLASLDSLSGGRLTVAVGVGWSAREFAALGQSFADRGRRTDEILELLRR